MASDRAMKRAAEILTELGADPGEVEPMAEVLDNFAAEHHRLYLDRLRALVAPMVDPSSEQRAKAIERLRAWAVAHPMVGAEAAEDIDDGQAVYLDDDGKARRMPAADPDNTRVVVDFSGMGPRWCVGEDLRAGVVATVDRSTGMLVVDRGVEP